MHPVIASSIPGSAGIVAAPVVADAERDNADAEPCAVFDNRNAASLVVVVQIVTVYPAAIAFPINIAPGPIVDATVQIQ
jgi:hypothetical protein